MTLDEIDAIVVGKAPDLFEGVMMPELFLAESLGAAGKPLLRVHTAGSVGGSTAIVASSLVQAGVHKKVLTVAYEKQSESNAMWALSVPIPFNMPVHAGAGGYFAPHVRSYIRRSGAPTHIGAIVAAKDRQNALKNPYAHLRNPDTTVESVLASQMLWDPIRYDETCPSSDGACALVIVDRGRRAAVAQPGVDPRHRDALRGHLGRRARPGQPAGLPRRRRRALEAGRHHQPDRRDRRGRDLRAVLVVRADVAGVARLRRRERRRLAAHRVRRHRDGRRSSRSTARAACSPRTRSAPPACSASARPRSRCVARPASTRSTAPARRWATRTAAARSSSRCGSSARRSRATESLARHATGGASGLRSTARAERVHWGEWCRGQIRSSRAGTAPRSGRLHQHRRDDGPWPRWAPS